MTIRCSWKSVCGAAVVLGLVGLLSGVAQAQIRYDYRATMSPVGGGGTAPPVSGRVDFDEETSISRKFINETRLLNQVVTEFKSPVGSRLGAMILFISGDPDPFLDSQLTFQNLTNEPMRFDFESALNMFAPSLPFEVDVTSEIELIDGVDGQMADGSASLVPPQDFIDAGLGMVRPGVGTLGSVLAFEFFFPPELNQGDGLVAPGVSMESSSTTVGTPPNFPRPGSDNWDAMLLNLGFVLSPMDTAVFHTRITVVPEPASLALLCLGGLVPITRHRFRSLRRRHSRGLERGGESSYPLHTISGRSGTTWVDGSTRCVGQPAASRPRKRGAFRVLTAANCSADEASQADALST